MNKNRIKLLYILAFIFLIIGCFRLVVEDNSIAHSVLGILQAIGFLLYAFPVVYKQDPVMKNRNRLMKWSGILLIITGLTSFSNHPDWGYFAFGAGLLILILRVLWGNFFISQS